MMTEECMVRVRCVCVCVCVCLPKAWVGGGGWGWARLVSPCMLGTVRSEAPSSRVSLTESPLAFAL